MKHFIKDEYTSVTAQAILTENKGCFHAIAFNLPDK
jgi:hypothetical protein